MRALLRKLTAQTANLTGSGGGGFDALTAGDVQGLLMSCDATPLTWEHFTAKHELNEHQLSHMLVFWVYKRLNDRHKGMPLKFIAKHHSSTLDASHLLADGLGKYLARHKIKADNLGTYFDIERRKFSRNYAPFIRECVADLEADLNKLERQIIEKLKKD